MTIRELAEGNCRILDIEVTIRNNGKFEHEYRFGGGAQYYPGDHARFHGHQKPEDYIDVCKKEINAYDVGFGKDYMQMKLNEIPKRYQHVLDMEVEHWNLTGAYRSLSSYWSEIKKLEVTVDIAKCEQSIQAPKERVNEKQSNDLEGQMQIEDFPEVLP